jgi:molecular chaperone DnaJ
MRDYYEVLGVARDADTRTIKSAYRRLAQQYHPDRNPGDSEAEEKFKEAADAYSVLGDADKRARYDRFGHQGTRASAGGFDPTIFADFSDILGDIFGFGGGGRRGGRRPSRGADLRYDLTLSFEEAAFGTETKLRLPRREACDACGGSGSAGGKPPVTCEACGGRGQVRVQQGFFTLAQTCPQCRGQGVRVIDPCKTCKGDGQIVRERELEVQIPSGVDRGSRLRLTGEGEHGRFGGPPGDLYVVLEVEAHPRFRRDGAEVASDLAISYPQAVLGSTVEVETLHGEETLEIPPGTVPGKLFRLRGKGIDRLDRRGRGDHVVRVDLKVPKPRDLDDERLALLHQLAQLEGVPVREGKLFDRVKELITGG